MKILVNNKEIDVQVFFNCRLIKTLNPKQHENEYKCCIEVKTDKVLTREEETTISEAIRNLINKD